MIVFKSNGHKLTSQRHNPPKHEYMLNYFTHSRLLCRVP